MLKMAYEVVKFQESDAEELADFLNSIRKNYWSLSSFAHNREPRKIEMILPTQLTNKKKRLDNIGTFLLKRNGRIISALRFTDKNADRKVAVFSHLDTHPQFQRRGAIRNLALHCIDQAIQMGFDRIEFRTWPFNRKGIPLYKRAGFRGVPGTSLVMESYLPIILKHPSVGSYFARHDYIRTLQNERSYGYDAIDFNGLSVFEYRWKSREEELKVLIDWQRKQITSIQRSDWAVWCFVAEEIPFRIFWRVENRGKARLGIGISIRQARHQNNPIQSLLKGKVVSGEIQIHDPSEGMISGVIIDVEIEDERISFEICRFLKVKAFVA